MILTALLLIGKVLLILFIIILLLFLLLLFFPVTYRISLKKKEKLEVSGKVDYLFSIFRIRYQYPEPGVPKIKILWFSFGGKQSQDTKTTAEGHSPKKPKKQKKRKNRSETIEQEISTDKKQKIIAASEQESTYDQQAEDVKQTENPFFFRKIIRFLKKLWKGFTSFLYTWKALCDKIEKIPVVLHEVQEFMQSDECKNFIAVSGKEIPFLWRHIRPRKVCGTLEFGFEDPADTGYVLALFSMIIYPGLGKGLAVQPDFQKEALEADLEIRGHFEVFFIAYVCLKIYFAGEFQKVRKLLFTELDKWREQLL